MIAFESRASTVLFNFLKSNYSEKKYILPSNVCPVIPLVFLKAGCNIEFCDIDFETFCINEDKVLKEMKRNPNQFAGICFVHTYGVENDCSKFFKNIKNIDNRYIIIDDRCLSVPVFQIDSELADLTLFSTGYAKYIDIGYGGYGFLGSQKVFYNKLEYGRKKNDITKIKMNFEKVMKKSTLKILKREKVQNFDYEWLNHDETGRFSDYKTIVQKEIAITITHKKIINEYYYQNLPPDITLEPKFQNWRFNILVKNKDFLLQKFFENDLFASSHYLPVSYSFGNDDSYQSTKLYKQIINLFNNQKATLSFAAKICEIIKKYS